MSFEKIFKLNRDGEIEISPMAKETPAYKAIIVADKGSEGDSEGRKKLKSKKEFLYIYHMVDPRSKFNNKKNLQEKMFLVKKEAGLNENWIESPLIVTAKEQYAEDIVLSATGNSYMAAESNLYSVAEDIKWLQEEAENIKINLRNGLKDIKTTSKSIVDQMPIYNECMAMIKNMTATQLEISKVIQGLPKLKITVDELAAKYAEEGGGVVRIHGGGELGNREK